MARRVLLLVVAGVVAATGAGLLYLYVQGAAQRATETSSVWVATQAVPVGTPVPSLVEQSIVQLMPLPVDAVLPGALGSDISPADEQFAELVTTRDLLEGEQLVTARIGPPGDSPEALAGALSAADDSEPPDRLLGTFEFTDRERVGGFVRPNSRVAVFYTFTTSGGAEKVTSVVLPSVEVAAVGDQTSSTELEVVNGEQTSTDVARALVTLRLTPQEMATLVTAQATGDLYLGLLPGELEVARDTRTGQAELLGAAPAPGPAAPAPGPGVDGDTAP